MKKCNTCKIYKDYSLFSRMTKSPDGLDYKCKSCMKEYIKEYKKENKERIKEYTKEYYKENKERIKEYTKEYAKENKERIKEYAKEYTKEYYKENKERIKEYKKEYAKEYQKENRGKVNAITAKRRAAKLNATPPWLTKQHLKQISAIYTECAKQTKESGIEHHVDHRVPLQGKDVCGLHVPWNLEILTATENMSKGNR